jgi:hypothetical protein
MLNEWSETPVSHADDAKHRGAGWSSTGTHAASDAATDESDGFGGSPPTVGADDTADRNASGQASATVTAEDLLYWFG